MPIWDLLYEASSTFISDIYANCSIQIYEVINSTKQYPPTFYNCIVYIKLWF